MTVETYCNHCQATISTLLILAGMQHPETIIRTKLDILDCMCKNCDKVDISLRFICGTAKIGSDREEKQV